jgi:hypothetical protein
MVGRTQFIFGKFADRTPTQAGLSVGSNVRGSVLIVTIETDSIRRDIEEHDRLVLAQQEA